MGSINYQILGVKGLKFCLTSFQRVIMYLFVSNLSFFYVFLLFITASIVDYYKVDKEDIVVSNTSETSPPALPPVAQTLPSQPLDVVFIERRGENR